MDLEKTYSPNQIESKWYTIWEDSDYFKPSYKENAPNYCIQLPPPNVTGTLHMGHGFQQTLMDVLVRYHRMRGYNTLWQAGTDHAGIATQIVVERILAAQGVSKHDLGRDEFIKRVWQWKHESGGLITKQMRRLGASCDWSKEQFTMNDDLSVAVNEVFVSLYEKGYIYRGKRLVNWDIKLQTAVSDLEVISTEENGSLWQIKYPIKDEKSQHLIIATTRPETMLGDVAVAVNPQDTRYQHLIGKQLVLPLVNREIPIIADEYVDMEFGTGCVKITPAHDFNDYEIGVRHKLKPINIMNLDGTINDNAPKEYQGLDRLIARKQILSNLESNNYLADTKPHKLMIPRGDRTNSIIEPMLTDQWFMQMDELAKNGLDLVNNEKVKFVPKNWTTIYNQWLENINDWCISRQLWWGHRIPAFYDDDGNVFVAKTKAEATKMANTPNLYQDEDVLDTWFSSALWCFTTLGWPNETRELKTFLPSNVLITGFDIIFFWVARMIMLTHEFTNTIPFKEVYITGLILDANGQKMSKSKGNTIDPIDLIDGISLDDLVNKRTQNLMNPKMADSISKNTKKDYPGGFHAFGADALRFTFALLATNGREIRFDIRKIEESRNFCNKLWNATRFVLMNVEKINLQSVDDTKTSSSIIDTWILNQLNQLVIELDTAYQTYRFDIIATKLYEFVWNEFCDWYVELAKVNLNSGNNDLKVATAQTLLTTLECILRLLHPITPFITEELWQVVAEKTNKKTYASIMIASYPTKAELSKYQNPQAKSSNTISTLKKWVMTIRNLRSEMKLNPGAKVPLVIEYQDSSENDQLQLDEIISYITTLTKISEVEYVNQIDANTTAPIAIIGTQRIMLKVEIDAAAEKSRLTKEIDKQTKELEKINLKLESNGFKERAPKDLVIREIARAKEINQKIDLLKQQLIKL